MITDKDDHNSGEIPLLYLQARDLCDQVFNPVPLPDSKEYDLYLQTLNICSPPYKPTSPSPSPVPIPAPIISTPVPPTKGKAKAIEAKKPTPPPPSPKKAYGDICPKCKRPYLYDHTAWAQGKTDGYTCRCKKDDTPAPSPSFVPLAPRPRTPSPKTTASEQANPVTTTQLPRERPFPYVSYDQFDRWTQGDTKYQCLMDTLYYDNDLRARLGDWKKLDNMEVHLIVMKGRLDGAWDALDGALLKLKQAKEDVQQTVLDFPQAY
jgi:hypothetical protein